MEENRRNDMKSNEIKKRKALSDLNNWVKEMQNSILSEEREIYSERVMEHYLNPKNMGRIENSNGVGKITGICGDTMQIYLKVENDKIADSKFLTDGCGATIACCSMLTEMIEKKSVDEAAKITDKDLIFILGGLPEENLHCAALAVDTLQAAIKDNKKRKR